MPNRTFFITACLLLALAVVFGAFGAHALKARLEPNSLQAWHTAVQYHFLHALGILILSIASASSHVISNRMVWAMRLLISGIALFSGSLYVLSTMSLWQGQWSWLGPITPIGGVLFVAGWVVAAFSYKKVV
jgi:uncharacterized membrane protein YgdD (TMEM256/DUF423 family)